MYICVYEALRKTPQIHYGAGLGFCTQFAQSSEEKRNSVINNYDTGKKRKSTRDVQSKLFGDLQEAQNC